MTRILRISILLCISNVIQAQDFEQLYKKLNSFQSFAQFDSVDKEILAACDYVLSKPLTRKSPSNDYYYALKSMAKWMNNTESYHILIFGKVIESSDGDPLIQNMFMAAMGKYLLEQKYKNNRHIVPVKQPNVDYAQLPEVKETLLEGARIFSII